MDFENRFRIIPVIWRKVPPKSAIPLQTARTSIFEETNRLLFIVDDVETVFYLVNRDFALNIFLGCFYQIGRRR